jgi:hypothetical protein
MISVTLITRTRGPSHKSQLGNSLMPKTGGGRQPCRWAEAGLGDQAQATTDWFGLEVRQRFLVACYVLDPEVPMTFSIRGGLCV